MDHQVARILLSGRPAEGEYKWLSPAASQLIMDRIAEQSADCPLAASNHLDELRKNIPDVAPIE